MAPDKQLYVVVGEMQREGQLQNFQNGPPPDDSGVILRVNPANGSANNPFASNGDKAGRYYAYRIRNSFGFDFGLVTGKLWDAENGEDVFDEINVVKPGFNIGWKSVMGQISANAGVSESSLASIPGSYCADPVFSWAESRGITDFEFLNSTAFGSNYENGVIAGDMISGALYYFQPNADRIGISLEKDSPLSDLVADRDEELSPVTIGTGFAGITEIETGPDGNLYLLTFDRENDGQGSLIKILSTSLSENDFSFQNGISEQEN